MLSNSTWIRVIVFMALAITAWVNDPNVHQTLITTMGQVLIALIKAEPSDRPKGK